MSELTAAAKGLEDRGASTPVEPAAAPSWLRVTSWLLLLAAFGWSAFVMTSLRTMSYGGYPVFRDVGSTLQSLAAAFVPYVLPPVALLTLRRRPLRWLRVAAAVVVGAVLFSELWAGIEEARWRALAPELAAQAEASDSGGLDLFARSLGVSSATIYQQRWWPFRHHSLYYDPTTQEFGGHD